jgi:hypothetical protein
MQEDQPHLTSSKPRISSAIVRDDGESNAKWTRAFSIAVDELARLSQPPRGHDDAV